MAFLKLPSRKIFVDFLSTTDSGHFSSKLLDNVDIPFNYIELHSAVWIQGKVTKVNLVIGMYID